MCLQFEGLWKEGWMDGWMDEGCLQVYGGIQALQGFITAAYTYTF